MATKDSGKYWVTWANVHAKNSLKVDDLEANFKPKVEAFIKALEDGTDVPVDFNSDVGLNTTLLSIGESYGVKKLVKDAPHWSSDGK